MATKTCIAKGVGHEPQLFDRAFKMQQNMAENGTMRIKNWDIKIDLCQELGHQNRSLRIGFDCLIAVSSKPRQLSGGAFLFAKISVTHSPGHPHQSRPTLPQSICPSLSLYNF
jgi:hypothetical protein